MDILRTILTILLAIDCIVLIVLVLLQEGKEGGLGGLGNARFKSSTRQKPSFSQTGQLCEEKEVILEFPETKMQ